MDYLPRECASQQKAGRRAKGKFRCSTWRLGTGASHGDCPRYHNGADSAEHVLFECLHVAPEARETSATKCLKEKRTPRGPQGLNLKGLKRCRVGLFGAVYKLSYTRLLSTPKDD